jgi:ubiquitin-conjugating enzyme E2 J2
MEASKLITIRRLKGELKNLEKNREAYYQVVQDKKDQLLFYFLLRGDNSSDYKGGYYIGKITLPDTYPQNPGDFYMLTPSGRFKVDSKICLTNSGYHKDMWSPMWNIKNMVIGFVSVFLSDDTTGISHIKESPRERKQKAQDSVNYNMTYHKDIFMLFDQFVKPDGTINSDTEVAEYIANIKLKRKQKKDKRREKSDRKKKNKKLVGNP